MKEIYKAPDGTLFESKKECLEYEAKIFDLFTAVKGLSFAIEKLAEIKKEFGGIANSKLYRKYCCRLNFDLLESQKESLQKEFDNIVSWNDFDVDLKEMEKVAN
jgi:hypothetical protein